MGYIPHPALKDGGRVNNPVTPEGGKTKAIRKARFVVAANYGAGGRSEGLRSGKH